MKKVITQIFMAVLLVVAVSSCREKSTGEKVEDAVEDVADDVEDAVD